VTDHTPNGQGALIPRAESLIVRTGNIVNWNRLKRSGSQSAASEVYDCISSTVKSWIEGLDSSEKKDLQNQVSIQCSNTKYIEQLPAEERQEYKITVKIFIADHQKGAVEDAVARVLEDLGVASVETVILSVPESMHSYDELKDLWKSLEAEVDAHRVYSLGVSDLNKAQLEELYNTVHVKPCINQVNLTTCCVIPQDLSEFAKEHDVQLLTHNDPPVILSTDECRRLIGESVSSHDDGDWQPYWVARYSVLIKARGVIKTKGFIARAVRD